MLTPAFELSQDVTSVTILIKARFAKVSETEIYIDGKLFKFYSKPYFLRLILPGALTEDGRESAKYDVDKGFFTVTVHKATAGEYFEGLDMLSKLLTPKGQLHMQEACIEVAESSDNLVPTSGAMDEEETDNNDEDDALKEGFDWQIVQTPYLDDETALFSNAHYGFANTKNGVFKRLQDELCGIVDVQDPDSTSPSSRKAARIEDENDKFNEDHYLADLYEDEMIKDLLDYTPPWATEYTQLRTRQVTESTEAKESRFNDEDAIIVFSTEENDQMRKLPRKEYLHEKTSDNVVLLSLVDIMFAYAYDNRSTEGENNVESAWTICKLSSTLCWMDSFSSLQDVIQSTFRRALTYPLYRHWKLNLKVLTDVKKIFCLGRRRLLKCLLQIHHTLSHDEPRYILNELYITDYCLWIQSVSEKRLHSIANALKKIKINKDDVGFDLVELEQAAAMVTQEEHDTNEHAAIQQYGYPEILISNAAPSAVEEYAVTIAQNEMENVRKRSVIADMEGETMDNGTVCENELLEDDNTEFIAHLCGTDDALLSHTECVDVDGSSEDVEKVERNLLKQVVKPLSDLSLNEADDTNPMNLNEADDTNPMSLNEADDTNPMSLNEADDTNPVSLNEADDTNPMSLKEADGTNPMNLKEADDTNPMNLKEADGTNPMNTELFDQTLLEWATKPPSQKIEMFQPHPAGMQKLCSDGCESN